MAELDHQGAGREHPYEDGDHADGVERRLPLAAVVARGAGLGAVRLGPGRQHRGAGRVARAGEVDAEAAKLAMHRQPRVGLVGAQGLARAEGIDGVLGGAARLDGAAVGPGAAALEAAGREGHVVAFEAGAVEGLEAEPGDVGGLKGAGGEAGRKCDVFALGILVNHEDEGAGHGRGAEAYGAPGARAVDAEGEVDAVIVGGGDDAEGELAVDGYKCRLGLVFLRGGRSEEGCGLLVFLDHRENKPRHTSSYSKCCCFEPGEEHAVGWCERESTVVEDRPGSCRVDEDRKEMFGSLDINF